jgi:phage-related protein (TIGR01555 family)
MAVRKSTKAFVKDAATADSYRNFLAGVGKGAGNLSDGGHYGFSPISRNRTQLEWCYGSSWIAGRAVDAVAQDMTREGVEINSSDTPDRIKDFESYIDDLQIWMQLCDALKWSRLYGGAVAMYMIEGQDPETPLRTHTVTKDQFHGLLPLDRWMVTPSLSDLITEMGPHFGKPRYYDTVTDAMGIPRMKIHYTRVLRFEGVKLPWWRRVQENLWGQSVLERLWDRLTAFDSTTMGAAQLVYKAHLRTYSIEGLREAISAGGPAMRAIMKHVNMIRALQTNEGLTLMDTKDKFETHSYTFAGLDSVLIQFGEQLCGALEIPAVVLFGQSPAGFNSGDSDLRNHYDRIKQQQVSALGPGVNIVYDLAYRSKFGTEPPKVWSLKFKNLWQVSALEKAQIGATKTDAVVKAYEAQIVKRSTALQELKATTDDSGMYSNITSDEINEAENDPAPTPEALGLEVPKQEPSLAEGFPKPPLKSVA